jgi:Transposase
VDASALTRTRSNNQPNMSVLDALDGLHRHMSAIDVGAVSAPTIRRSQSCKRSQLSVSISQSWWFQVHGVDGEGKVLIRRQLKRRYVLAFFQKLPSCLVGIEACASSHHWSRRLKALGHNVRLMPPAYVKPYVKRQKNDAADAEAICEAVTRANMRFVETKTPEQQSCLMLHRTRQLFIRQQTSVINAIRAHMAEFGIVAPVGRKGVEQLLEVIADASDQRVPEVARACLTALGAQLRMLKAQILEFDRQKPFHAVVWVSILRLKFGSMIKLAALSALMRRRSMVSTHHHKHLFGLLGVAALAFAVLLIPQSANSTPLVISKTLGPTSLVEEARVVVSVGRHRHRHWRCWRHRGRRGCGWRHW